MISQGISNARIAIQQDHNGNMVEALKYYELTIQLLQQGAPQPSCPALQSKQNFIFFLTKKIIFLVASHRERYTYVLLHSCRTARSDQL